MATFEEDLTVARAALAGDAAALSRLCEQVERLGQEATRRLSLGQTVSSELASVVRARVLVGLDGEPARLGEYSGAGPLTAWLRTIVLRTALNLQRATRRERALPSVERDALALPDADPELDVMKRRFREAFPAALEAAMSALHSRDRLLLKLHYLDGLTTERIAALYNTHRVTVSRWLVAARQDLLAGTREALSKELRAHGPELDSWLRLARSQLSVSIRRFLGAAA